jgi:hypothetical protein
MTPSFDIGHAERAVGGPIVDHGAVEVMVVVLVGFGTWTPKVSGWAASEETNGKVSTAMILRTADSFRDLRL